jgi:hypothetical protein
VGSSRLSALDSGAFCPSHPSPIEQMLLLVFFEKLGVEIVDRSRFQTEL